MAKNPHAVALGKLHKRKPDAEVKPESLARRKYRAELAAGKRSVRPRRNQPLEPTS